MWAYWLAHHPIAKTTARRFNVIEVESRLGELHRSGLSWYTIRNAKVVFRRCWRSPLGMRPVASRTTRCAACAVAR